MDQVSPIKGRVRPGHLRDLKEESQGVDTPNEHVWDDVDNLHDEVVLKEESPPSSWPPCDVKKVGPDWVNSISVNEGSDDSWGPYREWPHVKDEFDVVSVLFGTLNVCEHYIFFTYLII